MPRACATAASYSSAVRTHTLPSRPGKKKSSMRLCDGALVPTYVFYIFFPLQSSKDEKNNKKQSGPTHDASIDQAKEKQKTIDPSPASLPVIHCFSCARGERILDLSPPGFAGCPPQKTPSRTPDAQRDQPIKRPVSYLYSYIRTR